MTYGTLDGTLPPSSTASKPTEPQQYSGGTYTDGSTGHIDQGSLPRIPAIPGIPSQGANGQTSVDTSSLKKFADNLDALTDSLGGARTRVVNLQPIAAGTFNEAKTLAQAVTGDNGLQSNYGNSLHLLRQALMDTANSIRSLATKYSTIEEMNQKAGNDLQQLIQGAQGDIQALEQGLQPQGAIQGSSSSQQQSGQQQD
ncbi:hypothetical protein AB0D74_43905 [Streptomyces sp. NPDC048278]|uniref:hypothetical protein n=1 Tax=Streptomyces sp. NPDC048278 TaxID=3155809 RepID=UPI00341554F0